jgi:hypothetical protein
MAKIPTGQFGYRTPQGNDTTPMPQVDTQVSDAATRLGATAVGIADQQLSQLEQEKRRKDAERKQQDEALARSRAGDGLLDFEIQSKTAVEGIKDKVQRGELPYEKARGELEGVLARVKPPTFSPEHALVGEQYSRGTQRLRFQAASAVDQVIDTAQRSELKTTFAAGLDRLGKLALLPDTSLDDVFVKADAVALSGRAAGIPEADVAKQVQTFKDNTRFQRAQSDLVTARRNMPSLDAFQQRLETGDLSGTLDPDKRIALLKETDTLKFQAQNQAQHAADKRDRLAERAVTNATKQIETGLPLTAEGWTGLRASVEGTPYAEDFNRLVTQERDTQQVLRMPMADQQRYIQTRTRSCSGTGARSPTKRTCSASRRPSRTMQSSSPTSRWWPRNACLVSQRSRWTLTIFCSPAAPDEPRESSPTARPLWQRCRSSTAARSEQSRCCRKKRGCWSRRSTRRGRPTPTSFSARCAVRSTTTTPIVR